MICLANIALWSECLILVVLTMTKFQENLLRDSPLSLLFTVKIFSILETKMVLKIPNETFIKITRNEVGLCVQGKSADASIASFLLM